MLRAGGEGAGLQRRDDRAGLSLEDGRRPPVQRGDGPLEAAARYGSGEGCEMDSRSTGVLTEESPGVDDPVRVIRRAKRRVEPEAVNATPRFAFVWPATVVEKQCKGYVDNYVISTAVEKICDLTPLGFGFWSWSRNIPRTVDMT
jgi:hypothetical protein